MGVDLNASLPRPFMQIKGENEMLFLSLTRETKKNQESVEDSWTYEFLTLLYF